MVVPIVTLLLAVILLWQPARDLFGFGVLTPMHLVIPLLAGLAMLLALEALKPIWRRAVHTRASSYAASPNGRLP